MYRKYKKANTNLRAWVEEKYKATSDKVDNKELTKSRQQQFKMKLRQSSRKKQEREGGGGRRKRRTNKKEYQSIDGEKNFDNYVRELRYKDRPNRSKYASPKHIWIPRFQQGYKKEVEIDMF